MTLNRIEEYSLKGIVVPNI